MSSWKTKTVGVVKGIHLDPSNVRLELEKDAPEPDIMLDLFKNEEALTLLEGIVKVGYMTHEIPIAIYRDRKLVVVEGNRRLAALKAIHNPYLVPMYQPRISALVKDFAGRDGLRNIEVKIAPSQEDADQLVATLHAGSPPRRRWSPARQAAFFQAQIEGGQGLQDLRTNYPTIDVAKYVLRAGILDKFKSVKYSNPAQQEYVNGPEFSTSTLARIYESKDFIEFAGSKLTDEGELTFSLPEALFSAVAEFIVDGMLTKRLTTRTINTVNSEAFVNLMTNLRRIASGDADDSGGPAASDPPQGGSAQGSTSSGSNGEPTGVSQQGAGETGGDETGGTTGRPRRSPFLDVPQSVPPAFPSAVKRVVQEFSTLNIDRHPNAAFDLLRTLLEKTIKSFAKSKNEVINPSRQGGFAYLSDCLFWLEGWFHTNGPKPQVLVVKKIRTTRFGDPMGPKEALDAMNHHPDVFASPDDVRLAWDAMKSLIVEMLK